MFFDTADIVLFSFWGPLNICREHWFKAPMIVVALFLIPMSKITRKV